jgi:hypothetical protein
MLEINKRPQKTATITAYVPLGAVAYDAAEAASLGFVAFRVVTPSDPTASIAPLAYARSAPIAPGSGSEVSHMW